MFPVYRRHLSYCAACGADVCPCGSVPPSGAVVVAAPMVWATLVVDPVPPAEPANGPFQTSFEAVLGRHPVGTPVRYRCGRQVVIGILMSQNYDQVTVLVGAELRSFPLEGATLEEA